MIARGWKDCQGLGKDCQGRDLKILSGVIGRIVRGWQNVIFRDRKGLQARGKGCQEWETSCQD